MPVFYASPSRVVIYTDGDKSPETAIPPNLARVKFDTELEYVRVTRQNTVTVSLPAITGQTSGNNDPAYFQNHVLETHGVGFTPLVFGFATIGAQHIPLRGSVPLAPTGTPAAVGTFGRFLSLGSSSTQVILNEYAVRRFRADGAQIFAAVSVAVTYFITNVNLDA